MTGWRIASSADPAPDRPRSRIRLPRRSLIGVSMLFAVIVGFGEYLIRRDQQGAIRQVDARVQSEAATIRAGLEAELNETLYLGAGVSGFVEAFPALDDAEAMNTMLGSIHRRSGHVRSIGLAPDNVVTVVFPTAGNEAALGLRYEDSPEQWPAVRQAMETGDPVLAGPLQLRQGGTGLIERTPVFLADGSYWGIVSLIVDLESLLASVQDRAAARPVSWALRTTTGDGDRRAVLGDQALFDDATRVQPIEVLGATWELATVADDSLQPSSTRLLGLRGALGLVAMLVSGLALLLERERLLVRQQSLEDPLTHLANRRHLEQRLGDMIAAARRRSDEFSLVFVDLDRFKTVNDDHGHAAGDAVLTEVGRRLSGAVRQTDLVARVGGDEFIVLLPATLDDADADATIEKLADVLRPPVVVDGRPLSVGASIGVGRWPHHGRTASELVSHVDNAMYQAKRAAGDDVAVRVQRLRDTESDTPGDTPGDTGDAGPSPGGTMPTSIRR